jgi:protease II
MSAGHGGKAGRLEEKREVARDHAFLLWLAGVSE